MTSAGEYAAAGVDLARGDEAKARIGAAVAGTRTALSVGQVGAFGGMQQAAERAGGSAGNKGHEAAAAALQAADVIARMRALDA